MALGVGLAILFLPSMVVSLAWAVLPLSLPILTNICWVMIQVVWLIVDHGGFIGRPEHLPVASKRRTTNLDQGPTWYTHTNCDYCHYLLSRLTPVDRAEALVKDICFLAFSQYNAFFATSVVIIGIRRLVKVSKVYAFVLFDIKSLTNANLGVSCQSNNAILLVFFLFSFLTKVLH